MVIPINPMSNPWVTIDDNAAPAESFLAHHAGDRLIYVFVAKLPFAYTI